MAKKTSLKVNMTTALASACLGAAAGLLLVCCLISPTRRGLAFTRVTGVSQNRQYNMDLGTLGGCSDFLQGTTGGERDIDCSSTYGNGYQAVLLLPILESEAPVNYTVPSDGSGYPYDYNTAYKAVSYGMTRGLVMVPIATALAFIAMFVFIFGSYRMTAWADYATIGLSLLAAVLAWASFGIAYQLTDKTRSMLERYNTEGLHNGFTLETIRGNATWVLLAAAVLSTVAVPFTLLRQSMAKKAPQPTKISRKQSTEDEHAMEMA